MRVALGAGATGAFTNNTKLWNALSDVSCFKVFKVSLECTTRNSSGNFAMLLAYTLEYRINGGGENNRGVGHGST